jgi:hypothetical protein
MRYNDIDNLKLPGGVKRLMFVLRYLSTHGLLAAESSCEIFAQSHRI